MKNTGRVIFAAIYLAGTTFIVNYYFSGWVYDDTFITYRYAANLQNGLGFVYNFDERVLSTTTPLFTMLLALFGNLWADLPHLANLIGALGLAVGAIFLWDLAHTWKSTLVGWSGLLLYPTFSLLVSTLGSEIPLYLAFCLGGFAFYARQRFSLTAVCLALAVLTRPDGILVSLVLAIHYIFWLRRSIPWLAVALFLGIITPWFVFAWAYFGSPLPVTLAAKQHQGAMLISQRFASGFLSILGWYSWWPFLAEAGLSLVGPVYIFRYARHWALFLAWTLLYFLAYSALGVSGYFWYYAPLVPGFIVLLGLGISGIGRIWPHAYLQDAFSLHRIAFYITLLALVLVFFSTQVTHLWQLLQNPYHRLFIDNRMLMYDDVGDWLRDHTPQNASVGTLEVGIIGYRAQRKMIDFAGLIQPPVSAQLGKDATYEDAAIWAVEHYHPDYLVLFETQFPRLEQEYVARQCFPIQHFPGKSYAYPFDMTIYNCK